MSSHATGFIFFGWGVLLAIFSVFAAPRLLQHFSALHTLTVTLVAFAVLLLVMGFGSKPFIVAAIILSGACMGIASAIFTELALDVSDSPRPVASAGYNFVRWFAGVIAPYTSAMLGEHAGAGVAFGVTALIVLVGIVILFVRKNTLGRFA